MVEATNFVEKTLGVSLNPEKNTNPEKTPEIIPEVKEQVPTYTPPPPPQQVPIPVQPQIVQPPVIQIIEKIVYKKQRIHGFFRTLTIIALLTIGFLMLGESTGLITLSINSFKLHEIFPVIIIISTIIIRSYKGIIGKIFGLVLFLAVFGGIFTIGIYTGFNPSSKRKSGDTLSYNINNTGKNIRNNLYIETLIGNSYLDGDKKKNTINGTRNSDRNLLVSSGQNENVFFIKYNEDTNRNVLQNYTSNIDLTLPDNKIFDLIYIKNLLGLHTIDLDTFQRKMLKFHAGIDDITIKVGNVLSGNKIEIQGTAANIEIDIPRDVGVIMYYKMLIGKFNAPEFDATYGHYFQSQNIDTVKKTINLYINLGVGNTKINRVDPKN
ncbi:MAG: hypothetical protein WC010_01180 [Candidatus Absconditabacterales bacterium]